MCWWLWSRVSCSYDYVNSITFACHNRMNCLLISYPSTQTGIHRYIDILMIMMWYVCVCVCMCAYICLYTYMYVHRYIHVQTHAHSTNNSVLTYSHFISWWPFTWLSDVILLAWGCLELFLIITVIYKGNRYYGTWFTSGSLI